MGANQKVTWLSQCCMGPWDGWETLQETRPRPSLGDSGPLAATEGLKQADISKARAERGQKEKHYQSFA